MKVSNAKSFLIFLTEEQFVALGAVLMKTDPSELHLNSDRPPVAKLLHRVYMVLAQYESCKYLYKMQSLSMKGRILINR